MIRLLVINTQITSNQYSNSFYLIYHSQGVNTMKLKTLALTALLSFAAAPAMAADCAIDIKENNMMRSNTKEIFVRNQ